uniref:BTB domain-containing protein n=1 Tax=Glossina palpalis gambiensis TaxID=67801 RepID=A0A1B0B557_9MUSC
MFTNWLTGTSGAASTTFNSTSNSSAHPPMDNIHFANTHGRSNTNTLSPLHTNIISSTPNVILEVGSGPSLVRFVAHSVVLGLHSGYLRSAIRLDEHTHNSTDIVLYLNNVTPEQFAPLLSYMYTGYLDLNVENIFGILLATHVLHMPRALEICRSYLARVQREDYFPVITNNLPPNMTANSPSSTLYNNIVNNGKIIRPIASKPSITSFGFLPLNTPPITVGLPVRLTMSSFISSQLDDKSVDHHSPTINESNDKDGDEDIEVDEIDKQSLKALNPDGEDEDVFIDSNSETDITEMKVQKLNLKRSIKANLSRSINDIDKGKKNNKHTRDRLTFIHNKKNYKYDRRQRNKHLKKNYSSSGLQIAKAPIPASQLDTAEANKVIVDVASCDGPVRFKRILNTAYVQKPDLSTRTSGASDVGPQSYHERSLQSVSLSFHQQMAKTISQQHHHLHHGEESENSEASSGSGKASVLNRKLQNDVFVCVYCNHTFKSQYCYQKHAKRHLNPLTLQASCATDQREPQSSETNNKTSNNDLIKDTTKMLHNNNSRSLLLRNEPRNLHLSPQQQHYHHQQKLGTLENSEFLRREVRPLDMNVQYYPCKTCGSKFPSYYFVHKHRKMCHPDEEAQTLLVANTSNLRNNSNSVNALPCPAAASTTIKDDNQPITESGNASSTI